MGRGKFASIELTKKGGPNILLLEKFQLDWIEFENLIQLDMACWANVPRQSVGCLGAIDDHELGDQS